KSISERILQETGASFAGVGLVDETHRKAMLAVGVMKKKGSIPLGYSQPLHEGIVGRALTTGQLVCVKDTAKSKEYVDLVPGMRSELVVPLTFGGRVIGILDVESEQVGQFGDTDIALIQAIANPLALAIENARLYQEERKRYTQVAMLNQLSQVLTSTIDVDKLLNRVVETIREQLKYGFVAAGLLDEKNRVVLKAISSIYPVDLPIGHSLDIGEGITGEVLATGKSLLVPDVKEWKNYVPAHKDFHCEMCCPLRVADRVFGYLDAEDTKPFAFDEKDLVMFETVADHIAQAVENAENLRRVNKLREDLAKMIVHDLRNPLSVIFSSLEMLDFPELELPEAKRKKYLKTAKTSCHEVFTLVDTLLELQKIESGKLKLHRVKVNPTDIVLHTVNSLHVKAEAAGKLLTYDFPDDLPNVEMDRSLFIRVLQNLVMNAIKFTVRGGHIHISIKPTSKLILQKHLKTAKAGVLFSVQDDGCGIPPGELNNIFDKFTTLEPRSRDKARGTGLGLTFCRKVTLAHKGTIWAESEVGKGSTFHVLLPVDKQ
ncbi:MAG: GAF domain-containing sensor histidine kinase, partial [Candidatus Aminicenantes bacterium]